MLTTGFVRPRARVTRPLRLLIVMVPLLGALSALGALSSQQLASATTANFVATTTGTDSATISLNYVFPGEALIVVLSNQSDALNDNEGNVPTDSAGDAFSEVASYSNQDGSGNAVSIWANYAATGGGADTITATATPNGTGNDNLAVSVYEVAGVTGLDSETTASGSGTAISTGSVTTSAANEFAVVGATDAGSSLSAGSGWGDFQGTGTTSLDYGAEDANAYSSGSLSGTMSAPLSAAWAASIATFTTTPSLIEGGYTNKATMSPTVLQSDFGTPTYTAPTLGSEYAPEGTWAAIDGSAGSLAYLQTTEDWSTTGTPPEPTPGYRLQLAVAMIPSSCSPACKLSDGANTTYYNTNLASNWSTLAKTLTDEGLGNAWIRLGWEFDNNGYRWSTQKCGSGITESTCAQDYAAYWRNIVTTMRSEQQSLCQTTPSSGCGQFKFVWDPDGVAFLGFNPSAPTNECGNSDVWDSNFEGKKEWYCNYSNTADNTLVDAWPGAQYVNYIGMDLYDQAGWDGSCTKGTACWNTYIQPQLNDAEAFDAEPALGDGIPLAFPEWGVCVDELTGSGVDCQNDDPAYIAGMFSFMTGSNNVAYENYFDVNETLPAPFNSQITGTSFKNSLQCFQYTFGKQTGNGGCPSG